MSLRRVLIVNKTYPVAGQNVLKNKVEAVILPNLDPAPNFLADVKNNIKGVDAIIWNTKHRLTSELLHSAGPSLKAVSTMSSGLDHIDLEEIKKLNIALGHTPAAVDNSVADITVGLMIAAGRQFKEGIQEVESGDWKIGVQWRLGQSIDGSTVGVIGLGGVGRAVLRRLRGFEVARFLYAGRRDKPEAKELGAERVPLEQLLKESDYVIIACPFTKETENMINADAFKLMKPTSVLVNIGRGEIIDHTALLSALQSKRIFAAALDVTYPEPLPSDHPLVKLPNCLIMPHIGTATISTREAMAKMAANNILLALDGKTMICPV
ncbi:glyoxylate reductase/hydroxypyruvate reductase-like [Plodia interpunctella]|uniref:glyoxylate reductase/hydroxypyruvate reductase-like n=1 Tax=Plodia interpunctella TaxID=58824 RepID=UPI002368771A|nr:glyoxylate reductase/hydroxypyruvate reductase-like [Plodia interpunctella]